MEFVIPFSKTSANVVWGHATNYSGSLHPGKTSNTFVPLIDLTPSDATCVRSTIEYAPAYACRHDITAVLILDQQLWWIAYIIIEDQPLESALRQLVLILEMSFHCSIGGLMACSGLQWAISQVNAEDSVEQMLPGKEVSCAVHGHLMFHIAPNTIVTSHMLNVPIPVISPKTTEPIVMGVTYPDTDRTTGEYTCILLTVWTCSLVKTCRNSTTRGRNQRAVRTDWYKQITNCRWCEQWPPCW